MAWQFFAIKVYLYEDMNRPLNLLHSFWESEMLCGNSPPVQQVRFVILTYAKMKLLSGTDQD
jgi:hypothetical protein